MVAESLASPATIPVNNLTRSGPWGLPDQNIINSENETFEIPAIYSAKIRLLVTTKAFTDRRASPSMEWTPVEAQVWSQSMLRPRNIREHGGKYDTSIDNSIAAHSM